MRLSNLSVLVAALCASAHAQVPGTGVYPQITLDQPGFDQINVGNLNVRFTIPITSKAGRGLPFNYALQYEGLIWQPVNNGTTTTWVPNTNFGFTGTLNGSGVIGTLSSTYTERTCGSELFGSRQVPIYYEVLNNYAYDDPFGAVHPFNYSYSSACMKMDGTVISPASTTGNGAATDGSGYTLINSGTQVRSRSGAIIQPTTAVNGANPSGSAFSADTNGNQISFNGTNAYTDTTGTVELTISGSNPVQFSYPVINQTNGSTKSAAASLSYRSYTVRTLFNCSNIGEYGSNTVQLADHITLADGETYSFTYEGTPGAADGAVTGRLASLTLPSGGIVRYTYYGGVSGVNGILCTDGSVPGLNRSTTDGLRQYQRGGTTSPTAFTTTVIDQKNNQTVYHFSADSAGRYKETHQQVYQGTAGQSTPLQEVVTCYNGVSGSCDGQAITSPVTEEDTFTSYNGGSQAIIKRGYDTNGNLLNSSTYSGTTLLEQIVNMYNGNSEVLSSKTTDGSGNTVTLATYGYDETTPTATSGLTQHGAAPGNIRGNQTSAHVSIDGTASNMLTTTTAYYDTGMPVSTTVPGGFTTSFGYDSTQTFATSTTLPTPSSGVGLATSATYDTNSGALLSSTGMNSGQTTTVTHYDALLRPTLLTYPVAAATTTTTYTPNQVTVQSTVDSTHSTNQITGYDSYGRQNRTAVWNGSTYYITDTCYDATSLVQYVGSPYTSTTLPSSQSCSSGDVYTYDALGRVLTASHGDGSSNTWTYTNRAVKQADSTGVTRITQQDLLGRMTGVCEISSNASMAGSGSPAACGMDISGTGFVTGYAYDLAHHKVTVTQGVQTRIFQTDTAGRSVLTQEPERGQTTYGYAYNSTGMVVTRVRPKANQTSASVTTNTVTQYDSVGRVVSVTYNDGTPTKNFYYDQSAPCCTLSTMGSSKGQLTTFNNSAGHSRSYAYDIMGRPSQFVECLPDQCSQPSYFVWRSFTYDLLGELLTDQYATVGGNASPATITYGYNLAGQLSSVSGGQNDSTLTPKMYSVASFTPFGPASAQFGNQLNSNRQYDTVGNISGTWLCSGSVQSACSGGTEIYGATRHTVGGQVISSNDTATIRNSNFTYDEFGRLKSVTPADSNNSFTSNPTYDRYGNLLAENNANGSSAIRNPSWNVDPTTNHITGFAYDAAGNRLTDGVANTYSYDAEGNLISVSGGSTATFVYDALNERVKVVANGVTERYGFDLSGRRSTTWLDGSNTLKLTQYYAGGAQVAYWLGSDSHIHFEQQDGLGTERNRTTYNGAPDGSWNDLPWGDYIGWPGNNTDTFHFALLDHDLTATSGIEHAKFREYSANEGRWVSPDPYDGSYDSRNPQSLNRYSYVLNNPLTSNDPAGLFCGVFSVSVDGDSPDYDIDMSTCQVNLDHSGDDQFLEQGQVQQYGGGGAASSSPTSKPAAPNKLVKTTYPFPANAVPCSTSTGVNFMAPPGFSLSNVVANGATNGITGAKAAVAQFGYYDYQRYVTGAGTFNFYSSYTPVSNINVGAYLSGVGVSPGLGSLISNTYAFLFSSNGATPQQAQFRNLGFALASGKATYSCQPHP